MADYGRHDEDRFRRKQRMKELRGRYQKLPMRALRAGEVARLFSFFEDMGKSDLVKGGVPNERGLDAIEEIIKRAEGRLT